MFGVFQDVTDQRQAMDVLARSHARFKLLADNAADVIALVQGRSFHPRPDGRSFQLYLACGRAAAGWKSLEMAGRTAESFIHPDDRARLAETFAQMARGQGSATLEHRLIHRDGHAIWGESRMQLVRNEDGRPVETVS